MLFHDRLKKEGKKFEYNGDIDDLIETTLLQLNQTSEEELSSLGEMTVESLELAENILGAGAFRRELNRSKPINMNIFEVTLYFMSLILEKNQSVDAQKIESGLRRVIVSPEFSDYIGNSREQKEKVYGRFNLIVSLFEEISND